MKVSLERRQGIRDGAGGMVVVFEHFDLGGSYRCWRSRMNTIFRVEHSGVQVPASPLPSIDLGQPCPTSSSLTLPIFKMEQTSLKKVVTVSW